MSRIEKLLRLPTAPFHEQAVAALVRQTLGDLGVPHRLDRHGNIVARLHRGRAIPAPLALVAHMDHPGFCIERASAGRLAVARILGGVGRLRAGQQILFFTDPPTVGRVIGIAKKNKYGTPTHVRVRPSRPLPAGAFGLWNVPEFRRAGHKIYARAIDDVCGVGVMLEVLRRLKRRKGGTFDVYCCFTRAEEVGFVGAAGLARTGMLPKAARVVSIEMSKALPGRSVQGEGFVVRLGDKATVFEPRMLGFMIHVAKDIQSRRRGFRFQAALLDGGACEATLFNAMGYAAAGVALPLGNYHNRTPRGGIGPEYIDDRDLAGLIDYLTELSVRMDRYRRPDKELIKRIDQTFNFWKRHLRKE